MTDGPIVPGFVHDARSRPDNVISLEFLARMSGGLRFGATVLMPSTTPLQDLLPADSTVIATWTASSGVDLLADAGDCLLHVDASAWETVVRIAGVDQARVDEAVAALDGLRPAAEDGEVRVAIWNQAPGGGGSRTSRRLLGRSWTDIARNYANRERSALTALMALRGVETGDGRLILLHGEPGTGKTTIVRALMSEWRSWCEVHLITDPDRLFRDSSYLLEVLQADVKGTVPSLTTGTGPDRWKLMVAEDADAYLRSTARNDAGAALGRLLNATDGLLAQSSRALILLTTNEPLSRLHPAVTRPGRCLAEIEISRFDPVRAQAWLGTGAGIPAGGATLAELYHLRRTGATPRQDLATGVYL